MDSSSKRTTRRRPSKDTPTKPTPKDEVSSTIPDIITSLENSDDSTNGSICQSVNEINISSDNSPALDPIPEVELDATRPSLPAFNVPEKILIVYDCAKDEVITGFDVKESSIAPDIMLKRSLRFFMQSKHSINPKHEFALAVLTENSVIWLKDFTNNIDSIIRILSDIRCCEAEDIISLNKLFDLIDKNVNISYVPENINIPPRFVVRVLFMYGRSFTLPQLDFTEKVQSIVDSPYFTFDVLMTHEVPSPNNNCQKIFDFLQNIDKKGVAYFFAVARNALDLHLAMAKLLSHPLQRAPLTIANYHLNQIKKSL